MKRAFLILLTLVLCLSAFSGCASLEKEEETTDALQAALPFIPSEEKEIVSFDSHQYLGGKIIEKHPNVLVLQGSEFAHWVDTWGQTVYVITDEADEWCIGDQIEVVFSIAERPHDSTQYVRIIADQIMPPAVNYKPIIYLYPEEATVCSVKITLDGELTCTYPNHGENGWESFTAHPDGTLIFPDGKEYYALYWEGVQATEWDFGTGFCVRGEDTVAFLEWALAEQGLTPREANEFIMYWLPQMQENPYNVISFQTDAYTESAVLEITPTPDSLLRVFMAYYASDTEVEIAPQSFDGFVREGFTVVEWGGSRVG